jgi:uncharacterized protein YkwD
MKRPSLSERCCLVVLVCGCAVSAAQADPLSVVQLLRVSGCGGNLPALKPLQRNERLDQAAALWAAGTSPLSAALQSGYRARQVTSLSVSGSDDSILQAMRQTQCSAVADQSLRDLGVFHRGSETWLVMATPESGKLPTPVAAAVRPSMPMSTSAAASAAIVLQLVNEVRANGVRCGAKSFGPAPPLQGSGTLDSVASQHVVDMARHNYLEHVDLSGRSPADRVRATGYRETLVGENIAYGAVSAEDVVAGWLHSTGHCENIMDRRFVEMGIAVARGQGTKHGLYWDQVLTEPAK